MPVNTQAIGKTFTPTRYAVGREKIKEYALAVGETNPLHVDPEAARAAGYADVVAPPMFVVVYSAGAIAPAIFDPDGPGGRPLALFESGAILIYLAEKTGQLLSTGPNTRYETIQWVHFQMGGIGPMFGQVGFFHKFAGKDFPDKRPLERYVAESKRLLGVMETHLQGRQWFMDAEYTIADISMLGWVRNLIGFYGAR